MPKSRNRKDHKKKVNHFKKEIQVIRKRTNDQMMQEYMKAMQLKQDAMKKQETGVDVENTDIDVDLNVETGETPQVDLDVEQVDVPQVDVQQIEDAVIVEPEKTKEEEK
jgi:hypothetical protein